MAQDLAKFLQTEVGGNPNKKAKIPELMEMIGGKQVIAVRGDGNCLPRSIKAALGDKTEEYDELRKQITEKWDLPGEAIYHMDETCIDGLAIQMVMRLLGVKTLNIFQCFDGAGRKTGWRTIEVKDLLVKEKAKCVNLITINGCHYAALIL